jgi:chitodextrinase
MWSLGQKGMETPDSGFTYFPDQPEHVEALAAWESARNPDQLKEESEDDRSVELSSHEIATTPEVAPSTEVEITTETVNTNEEVATTSEAASATESANTDGTIAAATSDATPVTPVVTQETPKAAVNSDTSTKMSAVLATRLKLTNYHTTSKKLTPPVQILGQDAISVVFAEDATGTDRVLLHICLNSTDGKKSIVSSMKKVPTEDFSTLKSTLAAMNVTWRSKDQPRVAA